VAEFALLLLLQAFLVMICGSSGMLSMGSWTMWKEE